MPSPVRSRLDAWLPALLLVAGSTLFLGAGRLHPRIDASLGVVGSPAFHRSFAEHMLHTPNWGAMHLAILLGPVLWALAAAGATRLLPAGASSLGDLGRSALMLSAGLWSVAFVLDGYVGPRLAAAIVSAGTSADAQAIGAFSANQLTMARLGMLSIVLVGAATAAIGAALLIGARRRAWRTVVGTFGLALGAWCLLAALSGEFSPGPFTSRYWSWTALSIGIWFLMLGTVLPSMRGLDERVA